MITSHEMLCAWKVNRQRGSPLSPALSSSCIKGNFSPLTSFLRGVPLADNPPSLSLSVGFTLLDPRRHQRYKKQRGSRESLPAPIWSFLVLLSLTGDAFHGMLSCWMFAPLFRKLGCIDWVIFGKKGQLPALSLSTPLPLAPAPSRGLRFSNFMLIKQHTPNVCLLFVVHYFRFCGLSYTADSAGCLRGPRDAQRQRNISGPWALLTHCDALTRLRGKPGTGRKNKTLWRLEWPSVQNCSLKRMLKWIFLVLNKCVKKESHLSFLHTSLGGKLGHPSEASQSSARSLTTLHVPISQSYI